MNVMLTTQKATFRGVPFYFKASTTTGGRKLVAHDFVLSNKRYIQDLGQVPREFDLRIELGADLESTSSYYTNRDRFLAAIEAEGAGTLVHPLYGSLEVFAEPYSINEAVNNLGLAEINVKFLRADSEVIITPVNGASSTVLNASTNAFNTTTEYFASNYVPQTNQPYSFSALNNVMATVFGQMRQLSAATTLSSRLLTLISFTSYTKYIGNVVLMTNLLSGIFNLFSEEVNETNATEFFEINRSAFNNSSYSVFSSSSVSGVQLNSNLFTLDTSIKAMALINMYEMVIDYPFVTTEDVSSYFNITSLLLDQLQERLKDNGLMVDLLTLRIEVKKYLNTLDPILFKITEVETKGIPLDVFVYKYYGSLDLYDDIRDLNKISDPRWLSAGSYKLLTL